MCPPCLMLAFQPCEVKMLLFKFDNRTVSGDLPFGVNAEYGFDCRSIVHIDDGLAACQIGVFVHLLNSIFLQTFFVVTTNTENVCGVSSALNLANYFEVILGKDNFGAVHGVVRHVFHASATGEEQDRDADCNKNKNFFHKNNPCSCRVQLLLQDSSYSYPNYRWSPLIWLGIFLLQK